MSYQWSTMNSDSRLHMTALCWSAAAPSPLVSLCPRLSLSFPVRLRPSSSVSVHLRPCLCPSPLVPLTVSRLPLLSILKRRRSGSNRQIAYTRITKRLAFVLRAAGGHRWRQFICPCRSSELLCEAVCVGGRHQFASSNIER